MTVQKEGSQWKDGCADRIHTFMAFQQTANHCYGPSVCTDVHCDESDRTYSVSFFVGVCHIQGLMGNQVMSMEPCAVATTPTTTAHTRAYAMCLERSHFLPVCASSHTPH